jgi:hypothetical protein
MNQLRAFLQKSDRPYGSASYRDLSSAKYESMTPDEPAPTSPRISTALRSSGGYSPSSSYSPTSPRSYEKTSPPTPSRPAPPLPREPSSPTIYTQSLPREPSVYSPASPREIPRTPLSSREVTPTTERPLSRVTSARLSSNWSRIQSVVLPSEQTMVLPPSPSASAYSRLRGSEYEERKRRERLRLSLRHLNQQVIRTIRLKRIPIVMRLTKSDDMLQALFLIIHSIVKGYLTRRWLRKRRRAVIYVQRRWRRRRRYRRPFRRFKNRIIMIQRKVRCLLAKRKLQRLTQQKTEKMMKQLLKQYKKFHAPLFMRASFLYSSRHMSELRTIIRIRKETALLTKPLLSEVDWVKHQSAFTRMLHRRYEKKYRSDEDFKILENFFQVFKIDEKQPLYDKLKSLVRKLFSSTNTVKSQWSSVFVINHL